MSKFSGISFVGVFLYLLTAADLATSSNQGSREEAWQCRIRRLSASRPFRRIESEGGYTELWNENEEQFQCAGVAAMRNTIRPRCLSLPNYSPQPRLVYVQRGQGLIGVSYPGCPETFHSGEEPYWRRREEGQGRREEEQERQIGDQHQKIHRIRQGDIVALPPGATHWCYNDGNEELVAFSVTDVSSECNQIDRAPRSFYLAGGRPREAETSTEQERGIRAHNILRLFDAELLAMAFNVPAEIVRRMQREDERGLIVKVQKGGMEMMRPTEDEGERRESYGRQDGERRGGSGNGIEEIYCNLRIHRYLDNPREADVYSRRAGRLYSVNMLNLPILRFLGLSAEKGNVKPNAVFSPHWNVNFHTIVLVTHGEGHIQVVNSDGRSVFNDRVREGDLLVIPQYFASVSRAGNNGVEWVSFKTSPVPLRSPIAGHTSVFKGLPAQVIANAYRLSSEQARELKYNREYQSVIFPPGRPYSTSY